MGKQQTVVFPCDAPEILFLTDGGLETTLLFLEGRPLPCFAAFDLLKCKEGHDAILAYYRRYLAIALNFKTGFILESPTWRASPDWFAKLGYPEEAVVCVNEKAVAMMAALRDDFRGLLPAVVVSGCVGPRGDGYVAAEGGARMTADEAREYHSQQIAVFAASKKVDVVTAVTMNYVEEAVGIAMAARDAGLPVVISFTVEDDGRLASGVALGAAITAVDAATGPSSAPLYYMINCAHPSHFEDILRDNKAEAWTRRINGIRANASCKTHAELDDAVELDRGHPQALGNAKRGLRELHKHMNVFGGCCGTDEEHISEIARQLTSM